MWCLDYLNMIADDKKKADVICRVMRLNHISSIEIKKKLSVFLDDKESERLLTSVGKSMIGEKETSCVDVCVGAGMDCMVVGALCELCEYGGGVSLNKGQNEGRIVSYIVRTGDWILPEKDVLKMAFLDGRTYFYKAGNTVSYVKTGSLAKEVLNAFSRKKMGDELIESAVGSVMDSANYGDMLVGEEQKESYREQIRRDMKGILSKEATREEVESLLVSKKTKTEGRALSKMKARSEEESVDIPLNYSKIKVPGGVTGFGVTLNKVSTPAIEQKKIVDASEIKTRNKRGEQQALTADELKKRISTEKEAEHLEKTGDKDAPEAEKEEETEKPTGEKREDTTPDKEEKAREADMGQKPISTKLINAKFDAAKGVILTKEQIGDIRISKKDEVSERLQGLRKSENVAVECVTVDGKECLLIFGDGKVESPFLLPRELLGEMPRKELVEGRYHTVITMNLELLMEWLRPSPIKAQSTVFSLRAGFEAVYKNLSTDIYPVEEFCRVFGFDYPETETNFVTFFKNYYRFYVQLTLERIRKRKRENYNGFRDTEMFLSTANPLQEEAAFEGIRVERTGYMSCSFSYNQLLKNRLPGCVISYSYYNENVVQNDDTLNVFIASGIFRMSVAQNINISLLEFAPGRISVFLHRKKRKDEVRLVEIMAHTIMTAYEKLYRARGTKMKYSVIEF